MSKLEEILSNKMNEIEDLKASFRGSKDGGKYKGPSFLDSLKNSSNLAVIAEVKMKSPSQGALAAGGEDPVEIAGIFDEAGVNAISVLTDRKFFDGNFDILKKISGSVKSPLLCKDFIVDRVQIDMALLNGASAVLLITEILDDDKLADLYGYALSKGLDALVEAHFQENVRRALDLKAGIIGINNRNLDTLEENPLNAVILSRLIPAGTVRLSLSSCKNRTDAVNLAEAGLDGVLVGGAVMKAGDRKAAISQFLNIPKRKIQERRV